MIIKLLSKFEKDLIEVEEIHNPESFRMNINFYR